MPAPSSWPWSGKPASRRRVSRAPSPAGRDPGRQEAGPHVGARRRRGRGARRRPRRCSRCRPRSRRTRGRAAPPRSGAPRPAASRTPPSRARAFGPCTASTARVAVTSASVDRRRRTRPAASPRAVVTPPVFDAFGMTRNRSGSTHHTMMSSTTCASAGSSRCVYCARPGPIRPQVVGERPLQRVERARPRDLHRAEMRHVEHDRVVAARPVLLEHAGVLDRHVPAAERRPSGRRGPGAAASSGLCRSASPIPASLAAPLRRSRPRCRRPGRVAGRARAGALERRRRPAATAARARTSRAGAGSRAGTGP